MSGELKPCAHCGGRGEMDQFSPDAMDEWRVICADKSCEAWGPEASTRDAAITAWNRRAPAWEGIESEVRKRVAKALDPREWEEAETYRQRADEWFAKGRTAAGDPLTDGYRAEADRMQNLLLLKADTIIAIVSGRAVCGDDGLCDACSLPAHELTQTPGCGGPLPAPLPAAPADGGK